MSYWMGTTVAKKRARREWRGTPRTAMTALQRSLISRRLQRKRAERLRLRTRRRAALIS